jgi:hypothetical protein
MYSSFHDAVPARLNSAEEGVGPPTSKLRIFFLDWIEIFLNGSDKNALLCASSGLRSLVGRCKAAGLSGLKHTLANPIQKSSWKLLFCL